MRVIVRYARAYKIFLSIFSRWVLKFTIELNSFGVFQCRLCCFEYVCVSVVTLFPSGDWHSFISASLWHFFLLLAFLCSVMRPSNPKSVFYHRLMLFCSFALCSSRRTFDATWNVWRVCFKNTRNTRALVTHTAANDARISSVRRNDSGVWVHILYTRINTLCVASFESMFSTFFARAVDKSEKLFTSFGKEFFSLLFLILFSFIFIVFAHSIQDEK